jgi:hypothetical protein
LQTGLYTHDPRRLTGITFKQLKCNLEGYNRCVRQSIRARDE